MTAQDLCRNYQEVNLPVSLSQSMTVMGEQEANSEEVVLKDRETEF
jgi:hypothetical protein